MAIGFICSAVVLAGTMASPSTHMYNNIQGWLACILNWKLGLPLSCFILMGVIGLLIAVKEMNGE